MGYGQGQNGLTEVGKVDDRAAFEEYNLGMHSADYFYGLIVEVKMPNSYFFRHGEEQKASQDYFLHLADLLSEGLFCTETSKFEQLFVDRL